MRKDRSLLKKISLLVYDIIIIHLALLLALWVEFRILSLPPRYNFVVPYSMLNTLFTLLLFWRFRLYSSMWAFFGFRELSRIFAACFFSATGIMIGIVIFNSSRAVNYSILYAVFLMLGVSVPRVIAYLSRNVGQRKSKRGGNVRRLMVIGAGVAGSAIIKEIMDNYYSNSRVVCCVDDDLAKKGKYIHGIEIIGGRELIAQAAETYMVDEIIITMPSVSAATIGDILEICKNTLCSVKTLPGLYQLLSGEYTVSKLRDVEVSDLLVREPITIDLDEVMDYVVQKTVLVTGGGGSIGSELCRQIANYNPAKLIILDIYENNVYDLQQDLKKRYPDLNLEVLIGSVRDYKRMESICQQHRPDIVYHAAAHKHVPFMESSPNEAIKNNVFGTLNIAKAAVASGAKRFVLISSDKAVNPSSIMGATKRLCEMVIQMMDGMHDTEFTAVRFGNVLNSAGSVFPLFKKQIEEGGPVTITHKDIIRYFMTISEAVSLVLQAGCYAKGGEIFVLDMGDPVRIDDMARNLIQLSGYIPDVDIEVIYTGLRPGEKLFEEILMDEEGLRKTNNKLIYVANPIVFDKEKFLTDCDALGQLAENNSVNALAKVQEMVVTYKTPESR
ncbi:MAG: polysaccharide biosynthesis protein [Oscillospiraceae bacterium]|nr:polysaccharide biosynthesis protein [Oscillospiraceae bacterium]